MFVRRSDSGGAGRRTCRSRRSVSRGPVEPLARARARRADPTRPHPECARSAALDTLRWFPVRPARQGQRDRVKWRPRADPSLRGRCRDSASAPDAPPAPRRRGCPARTPSPSSPPPEPPPPARQRTRGGSWRPSATPPPPPPPPRPGERMTPPGKASRPPSLSPTPWMCSRIGATGGDAAARAAPTEPGQRTPGAPSPPARAAGPSPVLTARPPRPRSPALPAPRPGIAPCALVLGAKGGARVRTGDAPRAPHSPDASRLQAALLLLAPGARSGLGARLVGRGAPRRGVGPVGNRNFRRRVCPRGRGWGGGGGGTAGAPLNPRRRLAGTRRLGPPTSPPTTGGRPGGRTREAGAGPSSDPDARRPMAEGALGGSTTAAHGRAIGCLDGRTRGGSWGCVCVPVCACVRVRARARACACVCARMRVCVRACVCCYARTCLVCACVRACVRQCACVCERARLWACVRTCILVRVHVRMAACQPACVRQHARMRARKRAHLT